MEGRTKREILKRTKKKFVRNILIEILKAFCFAFIIVVVVFISAITVDFLSKVTLPSNLPLISVSILIGAFIIWGVYDMVYDAWKKSRLQAEKEVLHGNR